MNERLGRSLSVILGMVVMGLATPAGVRAQAAPAPPAPVFRDGPPAQRPPDDPGPAPGPGLFYIPGEFEPSGPDATLVWRKGFWTREQPGWTWLPARWDRTSEGWSFRDGRWIREPRAAREVDRTIVRAVVPAPAFVPTGFVSPWISPLTYSPFNPVVSLGPLGPPGVVIGGPFPYAYGPAFGVGPWGYGGFGFGGFRGGFGGFGPWGFGRGFGGFW